jgi:hypothetical protein
MEERMAPWIIGGALVVVKLLTTALILVFAPSSARAIIWLFILLHWPFIVAGVVLGAAPALFWIRLLRVRAKRAKLLAQEWEPGAPRTSRLV